MGQKLFIPVTDEILYERPDLITSPLMPFQIDHPCFRWLSAETEAVDPATVDIDPTVELTLTTTALHFSPAEPSHASHAPKCEVETAAAGDHTYQHVLRRQVSLPCKDAA